jgi:ribonucleotide monophosphatase NagD (HAD superfamily)
VAGKPHRPTAEAIKGVVPAGELRAMVGDRPATDGELAAQLDIPFALVLSGVTRPGHVPADADAAVVAPDLLRLVGDSLGATQ